MNFNEFSKIVGLNNDEWNNYVINNLCNVKDNYLDSDIDKVTTIRFLLKINTSIDDIKSYFYYLNNHKYNDAIKIVKRIRKLKLDEIHAYQRDLDILDCIIRTNEIKMED